MDIIDIIQKDSMSEEKKNKQHYKGRLQLLFLPPTPLNAAIAINQNFWSIFCWCHPSNGILLIIDQQEDVRELHDSIVDWVQCDLSLTPDFKHIANTDVHTIMPCKSLTSRSQSIYPAVWGRLPRWSILGRSLLWSLAPKYFSSSSKASLIVTSLLLFL